MSLFKSTCNQSIQNILHIKNCKYELIKGAISLTFRDPDVTPARENERRTHQRRCSNCMKRLHRIQTDAQFNWTPSKLAIS